MGLNSIDGFFNICETGKLNPQILASSLAKCEHPFEIERILEILRNNIKMLKDQPNLEFTVLTTLKYLSDDTTNNGIKKSCLLLMTKIIKAKISKRDGDLENAKNVALKTLFNSRNFKVQSASLELLETVFDRISNTNFNLVTNSILDSTPSVADFLNDDSLPVVCAALKFFTKIYSTALSSSKFNALIFEKGLELANHENNEVCIKAIQLIACISKLYGTEQSASQTTIFKMPARVCDIVFLTLCHTLMRFDTEIKIAALICIKNCVRDVHTDFQLLVLSRRASCRVRVNVKSSVSYLEEKFMLMEEIVKSHGALTDAAMGAIQDAAENSNEKVKKSVILSFASFSLTDLRVLESICLILYDLVQDESREVRAMAASSLLAMLKYKGSEDIESMKHLYRCCCYDPITQVRHSTYQIFALASFQQIISEDITNCILVSVGRYPLSMASAAKTLVDIVHQTSSNDEKQLQIFLKCFEPEGGSWPNPCILHFDNKVEILKAIVCINIGIRLNKMDKNLETQISNLKKLYPHLIKI